MEKIFKTIDLYNKYFLKEEDAFKSLIVIHDLMNYLDEQKELEDILNPLHELSRKNLNILRSKQIDKLNFGDLGFSNTVHVDGVKEEVLVWALSYSPLDITRQELVRFKDADEEKRKEINKNLDDLNNHGDKKMLDNAIKVLRGYLVKYFNKQAFILGEKIIDIENNDVVSCLFDDIENKLTLKIRGIDHDVVFIKKPALVIRYFYDLKKISSEYKNFNQLNVDLMLNLKSDQLRRLVTDINNRIKKESNNVIKKIIVLKEKKSYTEKNKYRWQIIV